MEQLKSVGEQVVVLMGASSGIGRESALRFARKGLGSWSRLGA
jgi:NADP-dependent 3-hydroxy acid dehydrogenase YdfG